MLPANHKQQFHELQIRITPQLITVRSENHAVHTALALASV